MNEKKFQKFSIVLFSDIPWVTPIYKNFTLVSGQMLKKIVNMPYIENIIIVNPYYYSTSILAVIKKCFYNLFHFSLITHIKKLTTPFSKVSIIDIINFKNTKWGSKLFYNYMRGKIVELANVPEENIIVWNYDHTEYEVFDLFPKSIKIFEAHDNWVERSALNVSNPSWFDKTQILKVYREIAIRSDIHVICNGKQLSRFFQKKRGSFQNIYDIPFGVDLEMFSPDKYKDSITPVDMAKLQHPIIGYIGNIQERFDLELLKYLVKANPNFNFVVIGPIAKGSNFQFNIKEANFIWLGKKPFKDIPQYIYHFDVGIVPHKVTEETKYMSPLKVYEYLAMQKPVVVTNVEGLDEIGRYCEIAKDTDEFNTLLRNLANNKKNIFNNDLLKNYTWENRVKKIFDNLLNIK
jgi:glycosyltransferase involved in cell wall biosynthesis